MEPDGAYRQVDPNQQYQADPNQQYQADPNQQYQADPNQQYQADPNQQYNQADPNQQYYQYGDPNQQQYYNDQYGGNPNQYAQPGQGHQGTWDYDDPNYGYHGVADGRYPGEAYGEVGPHRMDDEEMGEDEAMQGVLWGYVMTPHGLKPARRITLEGEGGLRVTLTNYGARVTSIRMPDRYGVTDEVLLGLDRINDYYVMKDYRLGCVLGRMSRPLIGIQQPDGHHIFDELMWETCITEENHVVFTLFSPTGEQGYPSDLIATADYWLEPGNRMLVRLTASCSAPTPLSLSLRLPFNLAGQRSGNEGLLQHRLMINARKYLEEDKDGTLTGEVKRSRREGLDFLAPIRMCDAFARGPYGGFDHHLILNGDPVAGMRFVARLSHHFSGRSLEIYSNSRCLHIDTLNNLRLQQESNDDITEGGSVVGSQAARGSQGAKGSNAVSGSKRSETPSTARPEGRGSSWTEPKKPGTLRWNVGDKGDPGEYGEMDYGEAHSGYTRSSKETESWDDTYQYGDLRVAEELTPQSAVVLAPEDYPDTVFDKEWTYTLLPGQSYERIVRYTFYRCKKPLPAEGWSPATGDVGEDEGFGEMLPPMLPEYPMYPRPNYNTQEYPVKEQYNPYATSSPGESPAAGGDINMSTVDNTGNSSAAVGSEVGSQMPRRSGEGDVVRVSDAPRTPSHELPMTSEVKGGRSAAVPA